MTIATDSIAPHAQSLSMARRTLDSGLTLFARRIPNKVVTIDTWVATGSACETPAEWGASHFLEHMLFKGTPRFGVGELDRAITAVGGVWNAGTSKDFTHYYVTVAVNFFDTALDAIADMVTSPLLDSAEFEKERLVILEEIRRSEDSPGSVLSRELHEVTFGGQPYGHPVLGTAGSVSALTRDTLADYHRRRYVPRNIAVLVAGDLPETEALDRVAARFSGFPGAAPESFPGTSGPWNGGHRRIVPLPVTETYASWNLPAPPIADADAVAALDVATTILGGGRSSRLHQRLKEQLRLANAISCDYHPHRLNGHTVVSATLDRHNLDAAGEAAMAELRAFAEAPPTPDELAKARRILRNGVFFSTETNTGQTGQYGYYFTLTGSADFADQYLDRIDRVTPEAASAVIADCLRGNPNLAAVEPAPEAAGQ